MEGVWRNKAEIPFLFILLSAAFFLSAYKLADSPPIWFDEGFVLQSAVNLADNGKMGIQFAPGEFASQANFFSTGYTVAYPVGAAMKIFGRGLLQARSVIVLYLLLLVFFFYLLAKEIWGFRTAVFASLLLAGFAPLYGNGRNVIGEVPGLFFLVLFLFFLHKLEKSGFKNNFYYAAAGLAAGFCVATKSLFLVLPPAIILAFVFSKKRSLLNLRQVFLFFLLFALPVFLWFRTQFSSSDSLAGILSTYSNPYAASDISSLVLENAFRFFTEAVPFYFLALFVVWIASLAIRAGALKRKTPVVELISLIFVFLVWLAYFRTAGWYRYFFVANALMLLYLPQSVYVISGFFGRVLFRNALFTNSRFYKTAPLIFLAVLISAQFYQSLFHSWTAAHYRSARTKELTEYFNGRDNSKSIFIYKNPEIAPFLKSKNYYQYLKLNEVLFVGESELNKISRAVPDEVIMTADEATEADKRTGGLFANYKEKDRVNKYLIFERKNNGG